MGQILAYKFASRLCKILLIILLIPISSYAEKFSYCGINLAVDALKGLDNSSVKITFDSQEVIVAKSNYQNWVLEKTFYDNERIAKIPTKELLAFLRECPLDEPVALQSTAITEIFKRGDDASFSAREFLNTAEAHLESLKTAIVMGGWEKTIREAKSSGQINLISEALAELVVRDPDWVNANILRIFYLLSEPVSIILLGKVKNSLEDNDLNYLQRLDSSLVLLSGTQSQTVSTLKQSVVLAQELYKDPFSFSVFAGLLEGAQDSEILLDLLYPKFSRKVIEQITRSLTSGQLSDAVSAAEYLMPKRTTPDSLKVVSDLIAALLSQPLLPVSDKLHVVFESYSLADPQVSLQYQSLLESRANYLITTGKVSDSEKFLKYLLAIRPDPNLANDNLRYEQALAYDSDGLILMFSDKVNQIKTPLSFVQSIRLNLRGGVLWSLVAFTAVLSVVTVAGWILLRKGVIAGALDYRKQVSKSKPVEEVAPESKRTSSFVKLDPNRAQSGVKGDYQERLRRFGLSNNATVKEIKSAYRSAVKEYHPDLNPNQTKEKTDIFSDLTKMYEELLELRKQLGLPE